MNKILSIIIISVILLSACGKKGPPIYQKQTGVIYKQS